MKLTKVISLLCVLSLLFAFVSCDDPAAQTQEPDNGKTNNPQQKPSEPEWTDEDYHRCLSIFAAKGDPVLPAGTGKTIPKWSAPSAGGIQDLPDYKVSLGTKTATTKETNVTPELKAALKTAQETPGFFAEKPRNVIVIIGDGMGEPQLKMSREYKGELIMDSIKVHRSVDHRAFNKADGLENSDKHGLTNTDSCAGGTAILSGYKTRYGYIGMDRDGNQIPTLAELAKKKKMKIGCVTNDCTTDATPADTLCHSTLRYSGECLDIQGAIFAPDVLIGGYTEVNNYASTTSSYKEGKGKDFLAEVAKLVETEKKLIGTKEAKHVEGWDMSKSFGTKRYSYETYEWWKQYASGEYGNLFAEIMYGDAKYFANRDKSWWDNYFAQQNFKFSSNMDGLLKTKSTEKAIMNVDQAAPDWPSDINRGFYLKSTKYPNFPEMVAYTITQLEVQDRDDPNTDGFFCMIENTNPDGWGHLDKVTTKPSESPASDGKEPGIKDENIKPAFIANEVQNTDEGVAVAIKYVLEHPDTLLVVTADHDTGGLKFLEGWQNNYEYIVSSGSNHSDALIPVYALGAGAELFTKDLKGNPIAELTVEQLMGKDGENLIWNPESTDYINYYTGAKIGELMGDPDFGCRQNGDPRYGGYDVQ